MVSDGAEPRGSGRLRGNRLLLAAVAAAVLLADQLTKLWALRALTDGDIHLFWTIRFHLVFNQGTAFGLGTSLAPVITVAALVVSVLLIVLTWSTPRRSVAALSGLVLGGALGNLGDRAFRGTASSAAASWTSWIRSGGRSSTSPTPPSRSGWWSSWCSVSAPVCEVSNCWTERDRTHPDRAGG